MQFGYQAIRPNVNDITVTPDGVRYLSMGAGKPGAKPFFLRWLLPALLKDNPKRWLIATRASLYALPVALWWLVGGWRGVAAGAGLFGLSGIYRFNRTYPVLVDAPALLLAIASAGCVTHGLWPLAVPLAIAAGCTRETAPAFAALFAWNPIPLVGMVPVAIRWLQHEGLDVLDDENRWILDHPRLASKKYHAGFPLSIWVLPWGISLIGLSHFSLQLGLTLCVAYLQCAFATDTVRLFMWSAPLMLAAAVNAIPLNWLPVFVALSLANPFQGSGA